MGGERGAEAVDVAGFGGTVACTSPGRSPSVRMTFLMRSEVVAACPRRAAAGRDGLPVPGDALAMRAPCLAIRHPPLCTTEKYTHVRFSVHRATRRTPQSGSIESQRSQFVVAPLRTVYGQDGYSSCSSRS